jgi:hypothetical protein
MCDSLSSGQENWGTWGGGAGPLCWNIDGGGRGPVALLAHSLIEPDPCKQYDNVYLVCYYPYSSYLCTFLPHHPYLVVHFLVVLHLYIFEIFFYLLNAQSMGNEQEQRGCANKTEPMPFLNDQN